jgi:uncharacterized protein (TIGR02246 family)
MIMKKLLATTMFVMLAATSAVAGEREEVDAAFAEWRSALSGGKAENVVKLYDEDAVLLATLANEPITNQKSRTAYFTTLTAKPKLSAAVNKEFVKLLDDNSAIISGVYTFSFEENGKTVQIPARYSFVYEKENGKWMIVQHHSSQMPQAN